MVSRKAAVMQGSGVETGEQQHDGAKAKVVTFLVILVLLLLAYMPVLQGYYVYHDDYAIWLWDRESCRSYPTAGFLRNTCGRPLAQYYLGAQGWLIDGPADANGVRFGTVLLLGSLGLLITQWLGKHQVPRLYAIPFAVAALTLPAFQTGVAYLSNFHQIAVWLFAFAAAGLAWRGSSEIQELPTTRRAILRALACALPAGALICVALLTYQPAAMMYFCLIAIPLLCTDLITKKGWSIRYMYLLAIPFLTMGAYFVWVHFTSDKDAAYSVVLTTDYLRKARWFLREPLMNALNFWKLWPSRTLAISAAIVIGLGLLADLARTIYRNRQEWARNGFWVSCLAKYLLIVLFVPLCYLPNLAARADYSAYRTLTVLSFYLIFLLFWGVVSLCRVVPGRYRKKVVAGILAAGCLVGIWTAHYNVMNYYVFPQTLELRYIKSAIRQAGPDGFDRIVVVYPPPVRDYSFTSRAGGRYDEFGPPATGAGFIQDIPQIVICAIRELNRERTDGRPFPQVQAEARLKEELGQPDERTLVIDMTRLDGFY